MVRNPIALSAISRRAFVGTGLRTLSALTLVSRSQRAPDYRFVQFHNQPAGSTLHKRLVELWTAVGRQTRGRVETTVFAENRGIAGSDPAALAMLRAGEIQFFTLMGGILANAVPVAAVQQIPFAFGSAAAAHRAMDGPLGTYLRDEIAASGLHAFPVGAFDNGMRQIATIDRPVKVPRDLEGIKMRVPAGQIFADTFRTLGAQPVTVNVADLREALRTRQADAQENPLAVIELFKLDEVVRYVSLTNHMWSGFNQLAHLGTWQRLPEDIRDVIERNVATQVREQREEQRRLNLALQRTLIRRGLAFNDVVQAPFKTALAPMYATWKAQLGAKCWMLLGEP